MEKTAPDLSGLSLADLQVIHSRAERFTNALKQESNEIMTHKLLPSWYVRYRGVDQAYIDKVRNGLEHWEGVCLLTGLEIQKRIHDLFPIP